MGLTRSRSTHFVTTHNNASHKDRTSNQRRDCSPGNTKTTGRFNALSVPQDERDSAHEFGLRYQRVGCWHGIAPSEKLCALWIVPLGLDAVNKKASITAEQDHVSLHNRIALDTINDKRVSRHDRGQHAPSRNSQAQFPRRAQDFTCKLAFQGVCRIERRIHGRSMTPYLSCNCQKRG